MEIDAFTFVAQLFNFALLIYLLRRFLYRPIQEAMKRRQETINARLAEAEREKREAEALSEQYRERMRSVQDEADEVLSEARKTAERLENDLGRQLRERMAAREEEWRAGLQRREEQELDSFRSAVQSEIVTTIREALQQLADEDLERKMCERFIDEFAQLTDEEVERLVDDARPQGAVTVTTSRELRDELRDEIESRLRERLGEVRVAFEVDPTRIAGIELRCAGHRMGWSIGDYLETLDESVRHQLAALRPEETDGAAV